MKVTFRPSVEERVAFMAALQREQQSHISQSISWIFFAFNLAVVPGLFIYNDMYVVALVVFLVNAVLEIFLLSWQQKKALREYVQRTSPEIEEYDSEVRIDERGITCEHAGNLTFYSWKNIRSIAETDQVIYFDSGSLKMFVPKSAFGNTDGAAALLREARRLKLASSQQP